jgi:hypothetical protein
VNDKCHPEAWVGCGFVATIENAPGEVLTEIEGISSVAAQIAWGLNTQKPEIMESYLEDLSRWGLEAIGWAWCDAEDEAGATSEGYRHAEIAASLPITKFIANMEEPYDAHGNSSSPKFHMPTRYCEAFRTILPGIEFAVTTTPRWASDQNGMRAAGAVLMPQAFFGDYPDATLDACCQHAQDWGWDMAYVRPLVQVYENPEGLVPDPNEYLIESADWDVGVVPYILEQALGGAGRASLTALVPAITRPPHLHPPPTNGGTVPGNEIPPITPGEVIGPDHGITALVDFLQKQPGMPVRNEKYNAAKPATWPWPERLERTLKILASDHDANI